MYSAEFKNNYVYIRSLSCFEPAQTLDCGQAFRWSCEADGKTWRGVAFNRLLKLYKDDDGSLVLNTSEEDFNKIWRKYFDLDRDYEKIMQDISSNAILKKAAEFSSGIRILNQDPWETLCSFIISQNNNIPRIKGIIERLCLNFGENLGGFHAFPTAESLAQLSVEDLQVIRSGFRAKYILDAARKVSSGEVDLAALSSLPIDDARGELLKINGVGPKVADCALLFSHGHISAFPRDVWIKRAMDQLFGGLLPEVAVPYAGIVQQYIFYYARGTKLTLD